MSLFAYNKTVTALALAAGNPIVTLDASTVAGQRGKASDVTAQLKSLSDADYASLQAQIDSGNIDLAWSASAEYATNGLKPTLNDGNSNPGNNKKHSMHVEGSFDISMDASGLFDMPSPPVTSPPIKPSGMASATISADNGNSFVLSNVSGVFPVSGGQVQSGSEIIKYASEAGGVLSGLTRAFRNTTQANQSGNVVSLIKSSC